MSASTAVMRGELRAESREGRVIVPWDLDSQDGGHKDDTKKV